MHIETSSAPPLSNGPGTLLAACLQGWRRLPPFALIRMVVMLCISLETGAFLLGAVQAEAAIPNPNCTLIVPANPLSPAGLATPYQLVATNPRLGPCHEITPTQSAFVQGAIIDPATGRIAVYDPLVIDQGTMPAIRPVVPTFSPNAIVGLWFGFNGVNLQLQGTNNSLVAGHCVNGLGNSLFGQFAYCNAPAFFNVANNAINHGKLTPPPLGRAKDGLTCPSTRDFSVVDQDQSDNVTTIYLALANGQTALDTVTNRAALTAMGKKFVMLTNPSDNRLLVGFIDPALGCNPWTALNLADRKQQSFTTALPLNELQAAAHQGSPVALAPAGDPMVLVNGLPNLNKLNLFRVGVDQLPVANLNQASTVTYCRDLLTIAPPRLSRDARLFMNAPSPDLAVANNLFTFLAQRFNTTWGPNGLNCVALLKLPSPITVTVVRGVAVSATIALPK